MTAKKKAPAKSASMMAPAELAAARKPAPRRPRTKAGKPAQWTRNRGEAPVGANVYVEVRLRNGTINRGPAGDYVWRIDGKRTIEGSVDIMAWRRVRKPRLPKAEPVAEPVRHFDRSDEPKRPYTEEISHPLADQLDPTTPARPVWDEQLHGDSDGLGAARGMLWSVVGILAVALLAVILRGCAA